MKNSAKLGSDLGLIFPPAQKKKLKKTVKKKNTETSSSKPIKTSSSKRVVETNKTRSTSRSKSRGQANPATAKTSKTKANSSKSISSAVTCTTKHPTVKKAAIPGKTSMATGSSISCTRIGSSSKSIKFVPATVSQAGSRARGGEEDVASLVAATQRMMEVAMSRAGM